VAAPVLCSRKISIRRLKVCTHFFLTPLDLYNGVLCSDRLLVSSLHEIVPIKRSRKRQDLDLEGPAKQKSTDPPRTFAKSQTLPPTIRLFFFLTFFFRQGEFKNTIQIFLQKGFPQKSTEISMPVFLDFFCFIAFWGVSQRWEFKNTPTNDLQNKVKFLPKI
jgi:hypothetical protein